MRTLAIDLSTRNLGWACDVSGQVAPAFDLVLLPGMKDLGMLYASVRNAMNALLADHRPDRMLFCLAQFSAAQTTARALNGVQAIAELTAYDHSVEACEAIESRARKMVLGRGHFGGKDPVTGGLVPGLGRKQAKAAVAAWCARQGYDIRSDDEGDALVLLHYDRMLRRAGKSTPDREAKPVWERQIYP